ncbi:MAG: hypothetical protein AAFY71_00820 [Bacteroidota bacterium]
MLKEYRQWDKVWEVSSLLYLGLPVLIFALLWLRFSWTCLIVLMLGLGLFRYVKQLNPLAKEAPFSPKEWIGLGAMVLIIGLITGLTYHLPQSYDYVKHHEIWQDLQEKEWPVRYQLEEKSYFLDYYLAYYLPSVALAKVLGISYVIPSILWGMMGLILVVYGFARWMDKWPILSVFALFLLGGQDLFLVWAYNLSGVILDGQSLGVPIREIRMDDPQHLSFIYKGTMNQLIWAPQHALGGWLASMMVINRLKWTPGKWLTFLPWVLTAYWSPFVTIGLLPFVAMDFFSGLKLELSKFLGLIPPFLIGLLFLLYYMAHGPLEYNGFIWQVTSRSNWFLYYLIFVGMELGAFTLFIWWMDKKVPLDPFMKNLFWLSVGMLLLIPFYHMGAMNDFIMRVSIPFLMIFYIMTVNIFGPSWKTKGFRWIFGVVFGLSCIHNVSEASMIWTQEPEPIQKVYPLPQFDITQLNAAYEFIDIDHPFDLSQQYLGTEESFFGTYLLASPSNHDAYE